MSFPSQFPRFERLMVMLMVMLHSDTKAVYFTAYLGLSLDPLKVAEWAFSGIKTG